MPPLGVVSTNTLMVNWFYPDPGPRDPGKMSPHHHDDFEQISLQLAGDYVHHIRTPWTADMTTWRDDDHHHTTSPAMTIIPPPSIHTSQAVGETAHQLIDIFGPPRIDFSVAMREGGDMEILIEINRTIMQGLAPQTEPAPEPVAG